MHSVMEKKKANNALKKAALTATTHTPITIAPAPISQTAAPVLAKKSSVNQSPAPPPITPTLGGFSGKGMAMGKVGGKEGKKEPRAKELAKAEGKKERRSKERGGMEMEMDGESDDRPSDDERPKKPTEWEIFQQLSSGSALGDSDARAARARSIAGAYEGRRSGRGGSLGRVGLERNGSDDGVGMGMRGTPAGGTPGGATSGGRKSKAVTRKLSEYEQFQQLSSPTTAGSPLPPRGRRPAALRATQTFMSLDEDEEEVEEETIPYAGPPVHLGHSRNNSRNETVGTPKSAKGKGKATTTKVDKMRVKREEVELGDEESSESSEEEEGPKTKWDEWQELVKKAEEGKGEGEGAGKRKRAAGGRRSVGM